MQVILNEQGYVQAYALVGSFGSHSVTVVEPDNIDDFEENYRSYYLSNDILVKSDSRQKEIDDERELVGLRTMRKEVCFPYINRGDLWYSKLTSDQREELDIWYQAWLDVTDTREIPISPEWLI